MCVLCINTTSWTEIYFQIVYFSAICVIFYRVPFPKIKTQLS